jgi:hypothetical protein
MHGETDEEGGGGREFMGMKCKHYWPENPLEAQPKRSGGNPKKH